MKAPRTSSALILLALSTFNAQLSAAHAQGTAFTYQGRLNDGVSPASGMYDLRFTIYDAATSGTVQGGPLTNASIAVSNGLFTATLDFGASPFTGVDLWLEIGVRTNGGAAAYQPLSPRQQLTSTPYATRAANFGGTVSDSQLSANIARLNALNQTFSGAVNFSSVSNNYTGTFTGNGAGLTNVTAATLEGLNSSSFWQLGGNHGAGATNGNFIGTTDFQALELKAGGMRVLRLEPDPRTGVGGASGNLIGGFTNNVIESPDSGGNVIGGGGYPAGPNVIHGNTSGSFIGAGSANQIGPNLNDGVIGGGFGNTIQSQGSVVAGGSDNTVAINATYSAIGGGLQNKIQTNAAFASPYATIAGGQQNVVSAQNASIGGGYGNAVNGAFGTVAGGLFNIASGQQSTVPGGNGNTASGYASLAAGWNAHAVHDGSFVWSDPSSGFVFSSTTSNQFSVRAAGGVRFVTGGVGIIVDGQPVPLAQVTTNDLSHSNIVNVVNGSSVNFAAPGVYGATISGGGAASYQGFSTLPNAVTADFGTVGGGEHNTSSGVGATIGGGVANTSSGIGSSVGGGSSQISSGNYATVPGGYSNSATGQFSLAAGQRAKATHDGAFVWADFQGADFASSGSNQFLVRASGGMAINTNNPNGAALNVAGTVRATAFQGDGSGLINVNSGGLTLPYSGSASSSGSVFTLTNSGTGPAGAFLGNVGIGTTSPQYPLSVRGGAALIAWERFVSGVQSGKTWDWEIDGSGTYVRNATDGNLALTILNGGNVGIGTTTPVGMLDVLGQTTIRDASGVNGITLNPVAGGAQQLYSDYFGVGTERPLVFGTYANRANQLYLATSGNVGIGTTTPLFPLDVSGNIHASGNVCAANVSCSSDRNAKENFEPADGAEILHEVLSLPISKWNFKQDETRHLGPMAQDFHAALQIGTDDKHIDMVDEGGVALAAIQGLNQKLEKQVNAADAEILELKQSVAELKEFVSKLTGKETGGK